MDGANLRAPQLKVISINYSRKTSVETVNFTVFNVPRPYQSGFLSFSWIMDVKMNRQKYLIAAFVATASLGAMLLPATACERNDFYIYGNKLVADFVQKPQDVCGQSIGNSNTRT